MVKLKADNSVYILHAEYLGKLSPELTLEEVDGIKTWISYGVFPLTYQAYLAQYPDMTELQKDFTDGCLFTAHELATTIEFSFSKKSRVKLEVFDIQGRIVAILLDEVKQAGNYSVEFNGSNLSSGFYVYKLTTDNNTFTRKMLLMK